MSLQAKKERIEELANKRTDTHYKTGITPKFVRTYTRKQIVDIPIAEVLAQADAALSGIKGYYAPHNNRFQSEEV